MKKNTWPALYAVLIDLMGYGIVYPLAAILFASEGATFLGTATPAVRHAWLSLTYLLYPLAMFFGASFLGDLSDRFGRRSILTLCLIGFTVGFVLMGIGVSEVKLDLFLIGRGLSGLFAGTPPVAQAAMADAAKNNKERSHNLSLATLAQSVGCTLGPLVGGFFSDRLIVSWFSLSTPFYIMALLGAFGAIWVFFGLEEKGTPDKTKTIHPLRPIQVFIEAFADRRVRLIAGATFCGMAAVGIFFQLVALPLHMTFGYSTSMISLFYALMGICFAISARLIPIIERWIGTIRRMVFLGLITNMIATGLFFFHPSLISVWILTVCICLTNPLYYGGFMILLSSQVSESRQGWAMGILNACVALSFAAAGLAPNLLAYLTPLRLLSTSSLGLLLAIFFMFGVKEPQRAK